jgi:TgpA N-terminal domain/Transglutaminase-like superfamily
MASHRRTLAAAIATVLASISLYPIFTGAPLWFWDGLGAVLVVAAVGTLTRLRRLPVTACLAAGAAGLLLYLNAVFSSGSLLGVLPTGASLRVLWDLAGQGFSESAHYAPPVPQLNGMLLLAVGGIGITALLTDLIAVRLQSAALAGLPLLLLFTEPFTLSASRNAVGTTVAFCLGTIGYLGLLSSEGRDRIREWEHPSPDPNLMPDTRALAAAGRRVGTASVVLALCVPLLIPGLHATQLFSSGQAGIGGTGSGAGAGGTGFPDPDTQLSNELHTSQPSAEFTYKSSSDNPDYFQLYVLDNLTGNGWQMFAQPESLVPVNPQMPAPPGLSSEVLANSVITNQVITAISMNKSVGQDALGALPVPYPASSIIAPGTLQADRTSLMVFDTDVRLANLGYSVNSLEVSPTAQDLNSAQAPPAGILSRYTQVPSSYNLLSGFAEAVIREYGAKTPFEEALALQQYLANGGFRYTLTAPTIKDENGLANFLENTKQGYCQQFSFAMAVLARLLHIPSRIAYGFTSGTAISNNQWLVTSHDAHAWPELYFQGFGWLRFEPTPPGAAAGQGTATDPTYTLSAAGGTSQPTLKPGQAPTPAAAGATSNAALGGKLNLPNGAASLGHTGGRGAGVNPWEVLGLSVLGLLVITAGAPAGVRLLVRRRRWRRSRSVRSVRGARGSRADADAARAHAAWRELRDDLVDYRVGYLPSQSPRAVAARAAATLELAEPAAAALRRIAMAEERARYAPRADSAAGLRQDSTAVRRAIAAAVPRSTRWRARLMPSSVLSPALAAVSQAADIFGRLNPDWFGRTRLGRAPGMPEAAGTPESRPRRDEALVGQAPRNP